MPQLVRLAEKYGTGIQFINIVGKMYPRDAATPYWYYQDLMSWISRFVKQSFNGADYLNSLKPGEAIDNGMIPKNFYLKRPDYQMCNHWLKMSYSSLNTETGRTGDYTTGFWINQLSDIDTLRSEAYERLAEKASIISGKVGNPNKYEVIRESIAFTSAVRLC